MDAYIIGLGLINRENDSAPPTWSRRWMVPVRRGWAYGLAGHNNAVPNADPTAAGRALL